MDEQEKAFEKFYREKAAKDLGRVESEIQALDPFYRRQLELQEDQLLRDRLKRDNIPIPKEEREFEVKKKKKKKKNLVVRYEHKKGSNKAYAKSPRPVKMVT
jgi:hypothetical protein